METTTENCNKLKGKVVEPTPDGYIYKTLVTPKAQGALRKRGWKDCKNQRTRQLAMRWRLLRVSEATPIKSRQHNSKCELSKNNYKRHAKVDGEGPWGLNPTWRSTGNQGTIRTGETGFLREEHTNWLSKAKCVILNIEVIWGRGALPHSLLYCSWVNSIEVSAFINKLKTYSVQILRPL